MVPVPAYRNTLILCCISIFLVFVCGNIFPFDFLQSKEGTDNPDRCPYYITLQSILANYPLLASDKANLGLIKQRLVKFENAVANSSPLTISYKNAYLNTLNHYGIATIADAANASQILTIARDTFKGIDNFYLDKRIFCINPLYQWNTYHTVHRIKEIHMRRILQYNLASIYDHIPNRYQRILGASLDEYQLGIFSGFFVNNQTTSLNIQLMTGIPMLTALYVLPGDNFDNMGTYRAIVPWNSFSSDFFLDPLKRKIMNIAGIDVFTVETTDKGRKKMAHVLPVSASLNKVFSLGGELHTYINTESYGMAYLANQITYADPVIINQYERSIKHNFAHGGRDVSSFLHATIILYSKLSALKAKHDIILESAHSRIYLANQLAGTASIKGIVGERAMFTTDCGRELCTFVFNMAKAPGWHALVNNKLTPIDRANFAFMAVTVPHGQATVWFIYQSWASLVSYLLSIMCFIWILFKKDKALT